MSDVFISYARSTQAEANRIAEALRALGYVVWSDEELPAHRAYGEVIEEQLKAAKAVVVIWSAEALKSDWVRAEADAARGAGTLVQLSVDGAVPPMPFNQIQCAELKGWTGGPDTPGWRKVVDSIADLAGSTSAPATPRVAPIAVMSKPSVAVMPFANLSNDPEQDYFADGMVEEIVAALSRYRSLFVVAAASLKGKTASPQSLARLLGVRYILEGSVRKAGGRVRIAVKLIDAAENAPIWADRFEDTLEDVFALQDRVALSVAGVIAPAIQHAEVRQSIRRPTANMGSYDLYLRALAATDYTPAGEMAALPLAERAIGLDPNNGPALGLLAFLYGRCAQFGSDENGPDYRRLAIEFVGRALEVSADDPDVLAWIVATHLILGLDTKFALTLADRAVALNPSSARAQAVSGRLRIGLGDVDRAVEHIEAAMLLDPLATFRYLNLCFLGMARLAQRRFEEAAPLLEELAQLRPMFESTLLVLTAVYGHLDRPAAAQNAIARLSATSWPGSETLRKSMMDWAPTFGVDAVADIYREGITKALAFDDQAGSA